MSTYTDGLIDRWMSEQDKRLAAQDELARVAEELGAYKLAHQAYRQQDYRCGRYFRAGWLCGLLTAALAPGLANLAYSAFIKGQ
jgi:hypothetical protein